MHALLLPLHLVFVGLWLGCVLTEALFERALLGQGRDKELILTALYKRVDLFVEIPAFALVVITGGMLLSSVPATALLHVKLDFALIAVITNIYCVYLVFKRDRLARSSDWPAFEAIDYLQHKMGAIVLIGILGALGRVSQKLVASGISNEISTARSRVHPRSRGKPFGVRP